MPALQPQRLVVRVSHAAMISTPSRSARQRLAREIELDHRLVEVVVDQGVWRVESYDLARVDDGDPIAEGLGLFHIVRGEEDRCP